MPVAKLTAKVRALTAENAELRRKYLELSALVLGALSARRDADALLEAARRMLEDDDK